MITTFTTLPDLYGVYSQPVYPSFGQFDAKMLLTPVHFFSTTLFQVSESHPFWEKFASGLVEFTVAEIRTDSFLTGFGGGSRGG